MIRPQIILPLLAALAALGPVARTQSSDFPAAPPPDAPPSKVKPAPLLRETLPNGLRVVIQENHRVPAVQIQMGIRAGLVSDPVDVPYMAVLAEHMVEAGSEKYNPEKREKAANGMGGELGIGLREDYVEVSASCLSVHFNKMLGLMADMVLNPKLDRDYMDAFTEGITEAVKRRRVPPPPDESKGRQAYAVRYPTAETVKKLDRDHVFEYLENYYAPNNSILVICGDVDAETAMTQVKSALGSWRPGVTPPLPHFVKEEIRPFYYLFLQDEPHAVESIIQMQISVPGLDEQDRLALQLANVIMGESLDSRLFRSIREKYGYVYSIGSGVRFNQYTTQFRIATECRTAVTAKCVKQIQIEVARMREERVSGEELQQARNFLARRFDLALQSQAETTSELFDIEFYKRPADYFRRLRGKLNAVTASDVLRVAKKYMFPNDSALIVVVGPKEKIVDRLMNANVGVVLNPDSE